MKAWGDFLINVWGGYQAIKVSMGFVKAWVWNWKGAVKARLQGVCHSLPNLRSTGRD